MSRIWPRSDSMLTLPEMVPPTAVAQGKDTRLILHVLFSPSWYWTTLIYKGLSFRKQSAQPLPQVGQAA